MLMMNMVIIMIIITLTMMMILYDIVAYWNHQLNAHFYSNGQLLMNKLHLWLIKIQNVSKMHLKSRKKLIDYFVWAHYVNQSCVAWWRRHRFGSNLARVMAYCLTAPSHYINQRWLISAEVHLRAISQRVPNRLLCMISINIILLKLLLHPQEPTSHVKQKLIGRTVGDFLP